MAKSGFNYKEPDCCGNCKFLDGDPGYRYCINIKQIKLPGNDWVHAGGYCYDNLLGINEFGKCDLHKREKK